MQKNLVIVESPAKAKTLEKFLGKEYKVMSSYGHIRDLKKKEMSVSLKDFSPEYEIPSDKESVVKSLRNEAKKADTVWLASDEDREGEAISWHLSQVLGLDPKAAKRIVFHEITKTAILKAIETPRTIDMGLVNAQQARRVLDRLVGFKLSPVLWKKLKPSLSAGRVQSVAVRLIVEREKEIENFKSESSYKVSAIFMVNEQPIKATLGHGFKTEAEAEAFLLSCKDKEFVITDVDKKPVKKSPAPPFTTSTLQQEAARKLGFTVSKTMMVAQHLYELGHITYMRTDSVNLSSLCINTTKEEIVKLHGAKYSKPRQFHTSSKGAQEAHEAIRPTYITEHEISGSSQEKRLYDLIWKRTVACQMADAVAEKTTLTISADDVNFTAVGEVITFDGFLRVYRESYDDDVQVDEAEGLLPAVKKGQKLTMKEMVATQRFTQHPLRYTEASLVKKMEELGIGRPSTYAPTISTIQQREYVEKGDKKGEERMYGILKLSNGKIKKSSKKEVYGNEKGKLLPTDIGTVVNDFLINSFPEIVDYNFTANVEKEFDEIADGRENWQQMMRDFYAKFEPLVDATMQEKNEHKVGERILGEEPGTGKPVSVKIGRFGPMVQIGVANEQEKPRFAQLNKGQSIATITLEEALELFKLPRTLGEYEGSPVSVGTGRFGPYVLHQKKYVSIPKDVDPMSITLEDAMKLIDERRKNEASAHLKTFEEDAELEVMNGRFGPYLKYQGANYKLPKSIKDPDSLTYEECMAYIEKADKSEDEGKSASKRGRKTAKA
ncbi:MAG: type I DNA topoisomerase [Bacteroidaceae bacterium]|nr:type I DNA topoisomerase [Bacteroidaceae bacterium]MBR3619150.1 type I DNA topoisomerase [Bacteroidaceae bacterium]